MKHSRFLSAYRLTKPLAGDPPTINDARANRGICALSMGVYNDGTYTLLPRVEAESLTKLAVSVFPVVAGKIAVFAVDWMGRLFAVDSSAPDKNGSATIVCLDLAEPSAFATDANFDDFHNKVAVEEMEDLLNMNQYREWMESGPSPGDGEQCVGYKVPLFLGGEDSAANMEISDRSTYLYLQVELWRSIGEPSPG